MEREFVPSNSPTKGGTVAQIKEFPVAPEEAAKFLKVTRATAMTMARTGKIPAHPLEGGKRKRWLFFLSELDAHVRGLAVNFSRHPSANQSGDLPSETVADHEPLEMRREGPEARLQQNARAAAVTVAHL